MAATRGKIYYRHPELFKVKLILKNSRETFLLFVIFFGKPIIQEQSYSEAK